MVELPCALCAVPNIALRRCASTRTDFAVLKCSWGFLWCGAFLFGLVWFPPLREHRGNECFAGLEGRRSNGVVPAELLPFLLERFFE